MTHQHNTSYYPVTKSPPDDVRLRAFCGVVCSLLSPTMVANADPVSCLHDSTTAEAAA